MTKFPAALLAVAALALSACGDDNEGSSPAATAPAPASTESAPAPASGGTAVAMKGFQFAPKDVTVKVGDTVTWTNEDDAPHNVVAADEAFSSENFAKGEAFEYTADKAGTFAYECTLHPGMEGSLTVQ